MARPIASLKPEGIEPALAYLRRTVTRDATAFRGKPAAAREALASLETQLAKAHRDDKPEVFRAWVAAHLTDEGRVRMLNAVRRRRADAKSSKAKYRSISLPVQASRELDALARKTGLPVTKLLAAFAAIGNVDEKLRGQLVKLAVATSLK
jgi:macrodomain Ter protein organizer (MatP/YcbG family)